MLYHGSTLLSLASPESLLGPRRDALKPGTLPKLPRARDYTDLLGITHVALKLRPHPGLPLLWSSARWGRWQAGPVIHRSGALAGIFSCVSLDGETEG